MSQQEKCEMENDKHHKNWLAPLLFSMLIFAAALLVYSNSVSDEFLWDDEVVISRNDTLRSSRSLPLLFSNQHYFDLFSEQSYRPVVTLTYFVDYALFQLDAEGYHAHNVFLHATAAVLVFVLFSTLPMGRWPAFGGGLLFAVHTATSEVVNVPSFREDTLCLIFMLACLLCFRRHRLRGGVAWMVVSVVMLLLASFSKESALMLLPVVVMYDLCVLHDCRRSALSRVLYYTPLFAATLFYVLIRFIFMKSEMESQVIYLGGSVVTALASMAPVLLMYSRLFFFPVPLCVQYNVHPHSLFSIHVVVAGLVLLFVAIGIGLWSRRNRSALFLFTWIVLLLVPVCNFLPLANFAADRYLYVPIVGVCGLIGLAVFGWNAHKRYIALLRLLGFTAVIALMSLLTFNRNETWADNRTVWQEGYAISPRMFTGIINTAKHYERNRLFKKALAAFRRAYEIDPNGKKVADALFGQASALQGNGQLNEALLYYQRVFDTGDLQWQALNNMGTIFLTQGRVKEAIEVYGRGQHLSPNNATILTGLAKAYQRANQPTKALELCNTISSLNKHSYLHLFVHGDILMDARRFDDAEKVFQKALQRSRGSVVARVALAKFYANAGRPGDAARELAISLHQAPDYLEAQTMLNNIVSLLAKGHWRLETARAIAPKDTAIRHLVHGLVLMHTGSMRQGMEELRLSSEADSGFAFPCMVLGEIYRNSGQNVKEMEQLREIMRRLPRSSPIAVATKHRLKELEKERLRSR